MASLTDMAGQTHVTTTQTADTTRQPSNTKIPEKPKHQQRRIPRRGGPLQAEHTGEETEKRETKKKPARSVTPSTQGAPRSVSQPLSLSQGTSNAQPEKECSVSSQVAVTCGCNVLHVQSNDQETMASFTLSVHSSSTRMQAYLGCWSVCRDNTRPGAHKSIKMEKGEALSTLPRRLLGELDMVRQQPIRVAQQCRHTTCSGSCR